MVSRLFYFEYTERKRKGGWKSGRKFDDSRILTSREFSFKVHNSLTITYETFIYLLFYSILFLFLFSSFNLWEARSTPPALGQSRTFIKLIGIYISDHEYYKLRIIKSAENSTVPELNS